MSKKSVIGVYDSLAEAEKAELLLEEAQLPVGQMSLIAPKMEAGKVEGDISARGVSDAVAESGIQLDTQQVDEYERVLKEGRLVLVFHGDGNQIARAHQVLEQTDNDELTLLGG